MPSRSVLDASKARVTALGITAPHLMNQVFASKDDQSGTQEDRRRREGVAVQEAAAIPALGGSIAPSAAPSTPKVVPPAPVIDRLHKEACSDYGGYIFVGHDHDPSEVDQIPPTNPGYRYLAKASSIMDAYAKAQVMQKLIKFPLNSAKARVAIIILGGFWDEGPTPINLLTPGIDFIGIGHPTIGAQLFINPESDSNFYGIDFAPGGLAGPSYVWIVPYVDTNPVFPKNGFWNCRFYSNRGPMLLAQGRFYAKDCDWYQLKKPDLTLEVASVPLAIQYTGNDLGPTQIIGGSINAYLEKQPPSAGVDMGLWPYFYALSVQCGAKGPFRVPGFDDFLYEWPQVHVELDRVLVRGSLYLDAARVQHTHCEVHGGIPAAAQSGNIYVDMLTRNYLNGDGSFNGYIPAHVVFDDSVIRSQFIARVLPNGNDDHPGMSYVQMNNTPHKVRYDHQPGTPFLSFGGNGTADVCNSGTGATGWPSGSFGVNQFGSCPTSVTSLRDFYLM